MEKWLLWILGFGWASLLPAQSTANLPSVQCGYLNRAEWMESKYVDARHVDVWLPEGYDASKKYPVLYMHDGQMLFDSSKTWNKLAWDVDDVMCRLMKEHKIRECIVVAIWNNGEKRSSEYLPQKALEAASEEVKKLAKERTKGINLADNYLKFIVLELKPEIDKSLPTLSGPDNTFIAGSSMGGLISLYAICEYPDVFGGAACLSTHWTGIYTNENNPIPEAIMNYLEQKLPDPKNHKIYFDHGTTTLDSLYGKWQVQVDKIMRKKGYKGKQWTTRVFKGAPHTETAWGARLETPLLFLLETKKNAIKTPKEP
jgi:predicted alpha/beta superfamily hydrolase